MNARYGCGGHRAFSLLEMAISLAVIALMTGLGLTLARASTASNCDPSAIASLSTVQRSLEQYVIANGRYPLPASRQLTTTHPDYGREVATPTALGIHRIMQASPVLIGGLPHTTLALPSAFASDCWGHAYTYAVSESFTTAGGYGSAAMLGGITLRHGTLASAQPLAANVAYVVLSHGGDALGASPASYGGALITCNSEQMDPGVQRIDKENCDTLNSIFFASAPNLHAGENFFDDVLIYGIRPTPTDECAAETVTWGSNCAGSALLTLAGLSVNVTNTTPGYTGLAVSTCVNGVRSTLGICLPLGSCVITSPRDGAATAMLTGTTINFGTGICKTYKCCSGGVTVSTLSPCLTGLDIPGLALSCP